VIGVRSFTHTYSNATKLGVPWSVSYESCCRLDSTDVINGANGNYRVFTTVDMEPRGTVINSCPVSTQVAIQTVELGVITKWFLPVVDADNDDIFFQLATPAQMGGIPQYAGVSIDNSTGEITFDATRPETGEDKLHAVAFVITDGFCETNVDFIVKTVLPDSYCKGCSGGDSCNPCSGSNQCQSAPCNTAPATCERNTEPTISSSAESAGLSLCVLRSVGISFDVVAQDSPEPCDNIRLLSSDLPAGASLTHSNTPSANPLQNTFSWIPAGDQSGSFRITFFAIDDGNAVSRNLLVSLFVPKDTTELAPPVTNVSIVSLWDDEVGVVAIVDGSDFELSEGLQCGVTLEGEPNTNTQFDRPVFESNNRIECELPAYSTLDPEGDNAYAASANLSVSNAASCGVFTIFEGDNIVYYPRQVLTSTLVQSESGDVQFNELLLVQITITRRADPTIDVKLADFVIVDERTADGSASYFVDSAKINGDAVSGLSAVSAGRTSGVPGAVLSIGNPPTQVTTIELFLRFNDTEAGHGQLIQTPKFSMSHGFDIRSPAGADPGFSVQPHVPLPRTFADEEVIWRKVNTIQWDSVETRFDGDTGMSNSFAPGETVIVALKLAFPFFGTSHGTIITVNTTSITQSMSVTGVAVILPSSVHISGAVELSASARGLYSNLALETSLLAAATSSTADSIELILGNVTSFASSPAFMWLNFTAVIPQNATAGASFSISAFVEHELSPIDNLTQGAAQLVRSSSISAGHFTIVKPTMALAIGASTPAYPVDAGDSIVVDLTVTNSAGSFVGNAHRLELHDSGLINGLYRVASVQVNAMEVFAADVAGTTQAGLASVGLGPGGANSPTLLTNISLVSIGETITIHVEYEVYADVLSASSVAVLPSLKYSSHPDIVPNAKDYTASVPSLIFQTQAPTGNLTFQLTDATTAAFSSLQLSPVPVLRGSTLRTLLSVRIPEGTTPNATIQLTIADTTGLLSVQAVSLAALPGDLSVEHSAISPISSNAVSISLELGTVLNSNEDDSVHEFVQVVLDLAVIGGQSSPRGAAAQVKATFGQSGLAPTVTPPDLAVQLATPTIEFAVGAVFSPLSGSEVDAGDAILMTSQLGHRAESNAPAFGIILQMPAMQQENLTASSCSINGASVSASTISNFNMNGSLPVASFLAPNWTLCVCSARIHLRSLEQRYPAFNPQHSTLSILMAYNI